MVSLHYNNCSLPILKSSLKNISSITPEKGKDTWDIRDATGKVLVSYNPRQPAKALH